jgi:membrane-bound metal-dependent hydrolase YbcI (DUF457 family)
VDIVTHGLASFAIARGFFPRAGKATTACAVLAGTLANIDWLSYYFGPSAYLTWHKTYFHSVFTAVLVSVALVASLFAVSNGKNTAGVDEVSGANNLAKGRIMAAAFAAPLLAYLLHIALDACQSSGVTVFWPFSSRRFAADWLPRIDPWILTILILCIAVPELLHLVGSEIGAKAKKPRGQAGAIVGLALMMIYIGARATLHSNVIALMEAHTFHGETSRRARAFPEALSLVTWNGVVETDSALNTIDVNVSSPDTFDADSSVRLFKPQPSPALDAARNTPVARRFLATAQIPKASLEKTEAGYTVILRDLRYAAADETQREVAAVINLDLANKVMSQELVWAQELRH